MLNRRMHGSWWEKRSDRFLSTDLLRDRWKDWSIVEQTLLMQTWFQPIDFPRKWDAFLPWRWRFDLSDHLFQNNGTSLRFCINFVHGPIDRPITRNSKNTTELCRMSNKVISTLNNFCIRTVLRQELKRIIDSHSSILNMIEIIWYDWYWNRRRKLFSLNRIKAMCHLPTVVKSILSRNKATKTMKRMSTRDERHFCQKSLTDSIFNWNMVLLWMNYWFELKSREKWTQSRWNRDQKVSILS